MLKLWMEHKRCEERERERRGVETETNRQNGLWKLKRDRVRVWSSKKDTSIRLTIYFTILRSNLLCPWAILHAHCRGQPNTESLYIPFISIWYCSILATSTSAAFKWGLWLKTHHLSNITTKTIKNQYWQLLLFFPPRLVPSVKKEAFTLWFKRENI